MDDADPLEREIDSLVWHICEGEITDDRSQALHALLDESPSARRMYVQAMAFHAELSRLTAVVRESHLLFDALQRVVAETPSPETAFLDAAAPGVLAAGIAKTTSRGTAPIAHGASARSGWYSLLCRRWSLSIAAATIAVLFVVAVMAYLRAPQRHFPPLVDRHRNEEKNGGGIENDLFAATLTDVSGCRWENFEGEELPEKTFYRGRGLHSGEMLYLREGLAELKFAQGATLILAGPCELTVHHANGMKLHRGEIVARVPKRASGFEVAVPQGIVRDLGTEFGVRVDEAGRTDLEVFVGLVEIVAIEELSDDPERCEEDRSGATVVGPGSAVRWGEGRILEGNTTGRSFARAMINERWSKVPLVNSGFELPEILQDHEHLVPDGWGFLPRLNVEGETSLLNVDPYPRVGVELGTSPVVPATVEGKQWAYITQVGGVLYQPLPLECLGHRLILSATIARHAAARGDFNYDVGIYVGSEKTGPRRVWKQYNNPAQMEVLESKRVQLPFDASALELAEDEIAFIGFRVHSQSLLILFDDVDLMKVEDEPPDP